MVEELADLHEFDPAEIEIQTIGSKPGEKLFEELINEEEIRRTLELERYFVVLPAFKSRYEEVQYSYPGMSTPGVREPYNSTLREPMSKRDLREFLRQQLLLEESDSCAS